MELLTIFGVLWARRVAVGIGALVAVAVGGFALGRIAPGASATTWTASTRVLIDTTHSQLLNVAPAGVDTLPMRAYLLADLVAEEPLRTLVADDAGVPANRLDVLVPSSTATPQALTPLVTETARFAGSARGKYVVTLSADGQSSIISIEASAPDPARADALASATVRVLSSSLAPPQAGAPGEFVAAGLGAPSTTVATRQSRHRLLAAIASLTVFGLWCAGVVVVCGVAGRVHGPQLA